MSAVNMGCSLTLLTCHRPFLFLFWGNFSLECGRHEWKLPPQEFEYPDELIDHMKDEDHTKDPFIQCPSCSEKVHLNEIKPHYKECLITKRRVEGRIKSRQKQKEWAEREKEQIREREREKVACEECGKMVGKKMLKSHLKIHLRERGVTEEEANTQGLKSIGNILARIFVRLQHEQEQGNHALLWVKPRA